MPNYRNTFPTLTKKERELLDLHVESITKVQRPMLIDIMMGEDYIVNAGKRSEHKFNLNRQEIVETPGSIPNKAWQELNAIHVPYTDESTRQRREGGSQTETLRAACKRIETAFLAAFGEPYPAPVSDGFTLTALEGGCKIWRLR